MSRAAAMLLYDPLKNTIAGLEPMSFVGIASPFLGVKGHTYLPLPRGLEKLLAFAFGASGRDLFHTDGDEENEENSLILKMCTEDTFLAPMCLFKFRRLYAALSNDFMVPLSVSTPHEHIHTLINTHILTHIFSST